MCDKITTIRIVWSNEDIRHVQSQSRFDCAAGFTTLCWSIEKVSEKVSEGGLLGGC